MPLPPYLWYRLCFGLEHRWIILDHTPYSRVFIFLWVVLRAFILSTFKQPQLFVLPLIKQVLHATHSFPQSHLHSHVDKRCFVAPSRLITTSRPNRCPVKSLSVLIVDIEHKIEVCAVILNQIAPYRQSVFLGDVKHFFKQVVSVGVISR